MATTAEVAIVTEQCGKDMACQYRGLVQMAERGFFDGLVAPDAGKTYRSTSIAAEPFHPELVQELVSYKPKEGKDAFQRCMVNCGMAGTNQAYDREAKNPRKIKFKGLEKAFQKLEYYPKNSATKTFTKEFGAFSAIGVFVQFPHLKNHYHGIYTEQQQSSA